MNSPTADKHKGYFAKFFHNDLSAGIILFACAALAMIIANSPSSANYFKLLHLNVVGISVLHWINDGLMAIFFFVIGMEIKKEFLVGELNSPKKAGLPIAAALGGMIVPALVFLYFNKDLPSAKGWGIPMATDIAFALGVLSLFGKRIPAALKIFLLALAIVDDLGAVLVIAFFYTQEIRGQGLALAVVFLGLMILARQMGIKSYLTYIFLALIVWIGVLFSGVHATVAGVLIGLLTPLKFPEAKGSLIQYSPLEFLIKKLHPWISFGIMPIFAFANAGIIFGDLELSQVINHPIHQGIALGLIAGKSIGITLFSALAVLLGLGKLPSGTRWSHICGVSFLGGIGFTMALFISSLALEIEQESYSKIGIISGSLIAGLIGSAILIMTLRKEDRAH